MASFGIRRRRHRNLHNRRDRKITPAAIIAICIASALLVSIIIGTLLKVFLDEEAYRRLVEPKEEEPAVADPVLTNLPDLNAYPYVFGSDTDTIQSGAVSVSINGPLGVLHYTSPVSAYLAIPDTAPHNFTETMIKLNENTNYISGVFYPQASGQQSSDLGYALALRERALIAEFLRNGGNDVLLCNVSLSQAADYVSAIKADTPTAAIGIAVPLADAQANEAQIPTLLKACDFCALDLRGITPAAEEDAYTLLKSLSYYLIGYDMRLLLSSDQTLLISQLQNFSVPDYQIIE